MDTMEHRWCVLLLPAPESYDSEFSTEMARALARAALLATRRRTLVVTPPGAWRTTAWAPDEQCSGASGVPHSGPLCLLSTLRIAAQCSEATVALLGPTHPFADPLHYVSYVRDAQSWVERHHEHVVALVRSCPGRRWRSEGVAERSEPPTLAEIGYDGWDLLGVVYRADTLLRLMEALETPWWRATRDLLKAHVSPEDGPLPLPPFDLARDVLLRSEWHLRVRPMRPAVFEARPRIRGHADD